MKKKNPWLAGILNIIPGLGYLYLGKRRVFSYLLLLIFLMGIIDGFINPNQKIPNTPIFWTSLIIVLFAFMYDAFNEARRVANKKIKQLNKKKNPWVAGILNIIPGLGYLYIGKRKVFSYLLLFSTLLNILDISFNSIPPPLNTPLYLTSFFLMFFAFMSDAFIEAKG